MRQIEKGREGGKLVDIKAIWSLFPLPPPKTPPKEEGGRQVYS